MKEDQEKELDYYRQQMKDQEAAWKKRLEEAGREMEVGCSVPKNILQKLHNFYRFKWI